MKTIVLVFHFFSSNVSCFGQNDFESFYNKFKSDSIFQLNHVKFPIKGNYRGYDVEREWKKEDWPLMTWDYRIEMKNQDDSISIVQNPTKFFYGSYCKECGFSFEMEFNKFDNGWFLTYRQENNF